MKKVKKLKIPKAKKPKGAGWNSKKPRGAGWNSRRVK
jgi:hypothetical protein